MKPDRICLGVLGDNATIKFAAEELEKYLRLIDEELWIDVAEFKSVSENFENIIWIGIDKSFEKYLPKVEEQKYDDAIAVSVKDSKGFITGTNERSVLIAVYRFLRELGVRFVRPGKEGERIPCKRIGKINAQLFEKASYRHRGVCIEGAPSCETVLDMIDFLPKVSMNTYFKQSLHSEAFFGTWYNHSYNPYLEKEDIGPELFNGILAKMESETAKRGILNQKGGHGWTRNVFGEGFSESKFDKLPPKRKIMIAQMDGERKINKYVSTTNLCYSNEEVRRIVGDDFVEFCRRNPQTDVVHFWLADFPNNHCECDECQKKLPSDWYVQLMNEIDEKLTKENINTKIVFLLYYDLLWAPQVEKIENPERFIIMFAPVSRDYGKNYGDFLEFEGTLSPFVRNKLDMPRSLSANIEHLRSWQKEFCGDGFAYEYHLMWSHTGDFGYEKCARNLHGDIKDLDKIGLNGFISAQPQKTFMPSALPFDIMAETLWNKECDYDAFSLDYYKSAFGEDGEKVQKYLKTLSSLTLLYDQPVFGDKLAPYGPYCTDYDALEGEISSFVNVIDENIKKDTSCKYDWVYLKAHAEYLTLAIKAMKLREEKEDEKAIKAFEEVKEWARKNEMKLRKVFELGDTPGTLERKIFRQK